MPRLSSLSFSLPLFFSFSFSCSSPPLLSASFSTCLLVDFTLVALGDSKVVVVGFLVHTCAFFVVNGHNHANVYAYAWQLSTCVWLCVAYIFGCGIYKKSFLIFTSDLSGFKHPQCHHLISEHHVSFQLFSLSHITVERLCQMCGFVLYIVYSISLSV